MQFRPTMLTDKIKQLAALKAKSASLEARLGKLRDKRLAALPAEFGFASTDEFISAFRAATGGRSGKRSGSTARANKKGPRHRAIITDATRGEVKKLVESGKTGAEIAAALKISLPSVQNIKKALGLVQKRRK